jgi:hypothetical protein
MWPIVTIVAPQCRGHPGQDPPCGRQCAYRFPSVAIAYSIRGNRVRWIGRFGHRLPFNRLVGDFSDSRCWCRDGVRAIAFVDRSCLARRCIERSPNYPVQSASSNSSSIVGGSSKVLWILQRAATRDNEASCFSVSRPVTVMATLMVSRRSGCRVESASMVT